MYLFLDVFENVWKLSQMMLGTLANRLFINICVCLCHDTNEVKTSPVSPRTCRRSANDSHQKEAKGKQIQRINQRKPTPPTHPQKIHPKPYTLLRSLTTWGTFLGWGGVSFLRINEDQWKSTGRESTFEAQNCINLWHRRLHHSIIIDVFERRAAFFRCFSLSLGFCEPAWI